MSGRPDDPPPEVAEALPLAQAFRDHADPKLVEQYRLAKERLEREGRWHYVGNRDDPDGYVLSEFDGLGHALLKESRALIARIEAGFMGKLRSGELIAWAREGSPLAPWREIPASAWSALRLDDVAKGTVKGPGTALFDVRVGPRVANRAPEPKPTPPLPATGTPGRPSHMHLVEMEFERRREVGQLEPSLARESAALAAWFKANHPDKQPVTAKTIANRLRPRFPRLREAPRKPA
jgi:hypothetical protein